jgi:hypothetical protein
MESENATTWLDLNQTEEEINPAGKDSLFEFVTEGVLVLIL